MRAMEDDAEHDERRKARIRAAAEDRLRRIDAALAELPKVEKAKTRRGSEQLNPSRFREARVSTTDPQARKMKMGDGGWHPAYNVQIASDPGSRAIVGVMVSQSGTDSGLSEPMRRQVEAATGAKVKEHLTDGGYMRAQDIVEASKDGVVIYRPPPPPPHNSPRADAYEPCAADPPEVAEWRNRMKTEEARAIYNLRAATSETINADLKTHRGLEPFKVRGIDKVTCVVLWSALAYNLLHFGTAILNAS